MPDDLDEYLLDHYGSCQLGEKCSCIQPIKRTSPIEFPPWLGRLCLYWQPASKDQLDAIRKAYNKKDAPGKS
jgi:hypothetical protein